MMTEDLTVFFNTAEHAVTATYKGATSVTGIFENPHELAPLGLAMQAAASPTFLCPTADLDADPAGDALVVDGTSYTIAEHQPDGTGLTLLILKRSS